jgi:hypothetical protein
MNLYHNEAPDEVESNPVLNHLGQAADILEIACGVDHPETAEVYLKLALAH